MVTVTPGSTPPDASVTVPGDLAGEALGLNQARKAKDGDRHSAARRLAQRLHHDVLLLVESGGLLAGPYADVTAGVYNGRR